MLKQECTHHVLAWLKSLLKCSKCSNLGFGMFYFIFYDFKALNAYVLILGNTVLHCSSDIISVICIMLICNISVSYVHVHVHVHVHAHYLTSLSHLYMCTYKWCNVHVPYHLTLN